MLHVEIIRATPDEVAKVIRYDVKAEIPGLYVEIVTYCCHLADLTNCDLTNDAMAAARTFALQVLRARLSLWAAQPEQPIGSHQPTQPEPRRRRRTKAEIEAEAAEQLLATDVDACQKKLETSEEAPLGNSGESLNVDIPELATSAPTRPPENSPTGAVAEEMERKPEHEAILRQLAAEVYGPHWTARADVKSNVVVFAAQCLANKIRVRYSDGAVHPQVRC